MNRTLLVVPVLALAALTVACDDWDMDFGGDRYETPFHYGFDVRPGASLELETFNGSVEIRGWDQEKVDISGVKYANSATLRDEIRLDANGSPGSVVVRAVHPVEHHGNMGARFVVRVPHDMALDRIASSNGSIRIEDVKGPVRAHTSNGSMNLVRLAGNVDAATSNGSIELTELTGNAVLHTSNAHIQADHISGPVQASTSNGSISIAFDAPPKNDIRASTNNSSIEVSMPESSAARVRASTSNSSITTDFELTTQGVVSKNRMEGTIHGGGPLLDLSTSNGSIRITKP
jgi:DUF4097 and DUF4098 domain-containing protein YvlB